MANTPTNEQNKLSDAQREIRDAILTGDANLLKNASKNYDKNDFTAALNKEYEGSTPLIMALAQNNPEMTKILVDMGADVNKQTKMIEDKGGLRPIDVAITQDNPDLIKSLNSQGKLQLDANDKNTIPPMVQAIRSQNFKAAMELLHAGADPNAKMGKTLNSSSSAIVGLTGAYSDMTKEKKKDYDNFSKELFSKGVDLIPYAHVKRMSENIDYAEKNKMDGTDADTAQSAFKIAAKILDKNMPLVKVAKVKTLSNSKIEQTIEVYKSYAQSYPIAKKANDIPSEVTKLQATVATEKIDAIARKSNLSTDLPLPDLQKENQIGKEEVVEKSKKIGKLMKKSMSQKVISKLTLKTLSKAENVKQR